MWSSEYIDRVETAAEPYFQHRNVDLASREKPDRRKRAEFEVGQRHVASNRLDSGKSGAQLRVVRHDPIYADPLVVAQQMRGGVTADAITRATQDSFEHGARRTLAVGAAHEYDRKGRLELQTPLDLANPIEPERDALRMQLLQVGEPSG
jgi:hypothetical protein